MVSWDGARLSPRANKGQPELFIITDIHGNEFSPDDADGEATGVTPSATPSGGFTAAPTFPAPTNDKTRDTNESTGVEPDTDESTGVEVSRQSAGVDESMRRANTRYNLQPQQKLVYSLLQRRCTNKHKLHPVQQHLIWEERIKNHSKFNKYYSDDFRQCPENPYSGHDDDGMQNYLNGIATYYQPERAATYLVNHIILTQYGMQKGIESLDKQGSMQS